MKRIALLLTLALAVGGTAAAQEHIESRELRPLAPALGEAPQGTGTPIVTPGPSERPRGVVMDLNESAYLFSSFGAPQAAHPLLAAAVNAALRRPQATEVERLTEEIERLTTDLERLTLENARLLAEISRLRGRTTQSPNAAPLAQQPQSFSETRVRSMGRTWTGVGMLAVGGWWAAHGARLQNACSGVVDVYDDLGLDDFGLGFGDIYDDAAQDCAAEGTTWLAIGLGTAAIGALLATVWSDVPAVRNMRSLAVSPLPGGARVTASYGF